MTDYDQYFQNLATNNRQILHTPEKPKVARIDYQEELFVTRNTVDTTSFCLLYGFPDSQIIDKKSDNPQLSTQVNLLVIKSVGTKQNFELINQTIMQATEIALQLIAKIHFDRIKQNTIKHFDRDGVTFNQITELSHESLPNCVGIAANLTIGEGIKQYVTYKPTDWL